MTQTRIRRALETPLKAWADAQAPAIPGAWENVTFTPPATGRYLRAYLLPAPTQSRDIGGANRSYKGVWQVTLMMPMNAGTAAGEALADAIAALYPVSTPLSVSGLLVYITQPLSPAPAYPDPADSARFVVPCSLAYRAETYP